MSHALADSIEVAVERIKRHGCCWRRSLGGGWYHTFDNKFVKGRIKEMRDEIIYQRTRPPLLGAYKFRTY